MSFKKTFCLLAGLVLAFGASDAFAQEAAPRGIRVRMVSPDSAGYAGIGKTIKVNVLRVKNLAPELDTVIVALRADTLSPRGVSLVSGTANFSAGSFSADTLGLSSNVDDATKRFVDTLYAANGSGTSVDTFKFTFTMTVGDPEANFVLAQAFISTGGSSQSSALYKLNNFNQVAQSTVTGFTDKAGDKRFAQVDGQRPVNGSIFDSVLVDTAAATANFPGTTNRSFKIGDQVKLKMHVKNFSAASAKVGIYHVNETEADSAMYSKSFDAATIVNAATGVRDSFTLAAGQFITHDATASAILKDNLRARVVAYLVDNAGNLGANSATNATPEGYSQNITYVFDTNAPTITIAHPDSAGDRFTGQIDSAITYRKDDGSVASETFALKPLKFKVSNEGTLARWAIVSKDTAEYNGTSTVADVEYVTADSFGASKGQKAGKSLDLSVVVKDSVGNKSTKSPTGSVTHDQVAPTISNLFPTSASLPEDKINNITRHPIFRISEVADTISVRFVQAGVSPPDVATQSVSASKLTVVGEDISVTVNDSLIDDEKYSLQVFIKDLASNVNFTTLDTLTFDKNFQNPTADSFIVAVNEDSVLAGQGMKLTVTAIDSKLTRQAAATRKAVTYSKTGVLVRMDAGAQDISGVKFWGTGVTDNGNGTANLDAENWVVGERDLYVNSTKTLDAFAIIVEDTSTTVVDGEATKVVNFNGNKKSLTVDSADLRKFMVTASDGDATTMQGPFQVTVSPVDIWGNPSMKLPVASASSADSLKLLDTRLGDPKNKANSKGLLEEIFVEFSSNMGDAGIPSGPQSVVLGGSAFTVVAPNRTGEGLTISVRTANVSGDTSGAGHQLQAKGSVTVAFAGEGAVIVEGAPAAPKNLVVQDYLGAAGAGDQGHYVMVSFPNSTDHAKVAQYRLYRELTVSTGVDADGNAVVLTTEPLPKKWVAWTAIDAVPAGDEAISRAVVPVTDNVATRWAVSAEAGGSSSEQVVAGKRVFTKESVQAMAQFLGVDANRIVSPEELGDMFVPSADYVKALLGDQKNVVFAALDPDVASLLGASSVPTSIRTAGGQILASAKTMTEEAVAAKDNLPPAAVTEAKVDGGAITWTASVDDRTVGYVNYRGFAIPIAGVTSYEVMGGASEDALESIGIVAAGASSFSADNLPAWIRVDALDLDNRTPGTAFSPVPPVLWKTLSDGTVLYLQVIGTTPNKVDFEDFIAFAGAFNTVKGGEKFSINADTDSNGEVNFNDFIAFAGSFNKEFPGPATKPVIGAPGVNENAEFSLGLGSDRVLVGETVSVDVSLANVQALLGYGFVLNYETDKFEFVEASSAEQDLLKSTGGETPLFQAWTEEAGQISVANAVLGGSAVSGGGDVVRLTFKVLREFDEDARFEIANGIVFDPKQLSNQAVVAGVLEIQSTPTEFALLQNFPNPFNPETTIQYNLSESADVSLYIYNVVGQVVRTLVAERQPAGRYRVQWSGTDDRGVPVSSGIYFYQISAGKFQDVRKLMLLK